MTKRVGVVGAGVMGSGIVQLALACGHAVVLTDVNAAALQKAQDAIARALHRDEEKGRLPGGGAAGAMARLTITAPERGLAALASSDIVVEAVAETLDVKQAVFRALERVVPAECVLATNTSSLSVTAIAATCERPERVLGVHFFNPPPVMPLVEIVPGFRAAPEVVSGAFDLMHSWNKVPVLAADTPGFIVNRIARPFYGEAIRMLEEGIADAPTIDWAMREIGEFRMGPFLLMDFIGLDVNYAVTESIWTAMHYDPRYRPSLTQKRLVEAGRLGRKSGRGFYDYAENAPSRDATEDRALGERIVSRIVTMLINEAVDAVFWKVATPGDIELAMTNGVNYPRGLLAWGDLLGLDKVLEEIEWLQQEYEEDRYRPSPLLKQLVREQRRALA